MGLNYAGPLRSGERERGRKKEEDERKKRGETDQ